MSAKKPETAQGRRGGRGANLVFLVLYLCILAATGVWAYDAWGDPLWVILAVGAMAIPAVVIALAIQLAAVLAVVVTLAACAVVLAAFLGAMKRITDVLN